MKTIQPPPIGGFFQTLCATLFSPGGWQSFAGFSMPPGVVPGPVDSASAPPSSGRGNYLPTQSQALYHRASSSPSARRPSSGFDGVNEEAHVRANAAVVDGNTMSVRAL